MLFRSRRAVLPNARCIVAYLDSLLSKSRLRPIIDQASHSYAEIVERVPLGVWRCTLYGLSVFTLNRGSLVGMTFSLLATQHTFSLLPLT